PLPAVHPRVRGDLAPRGGGAGGHCGSPPRARGPRRDAVVVPAAARFTPACAGTSTTPPSRPCASAVHPRLRGHLDVPGMPSRSPSVHPRVRGGDLGSLRLRAAARYGSPPRARGPPPIAVFESDLHRFTPACAGTSPSSRCVLWSTA